MKANKLVALFLSAVMFVSTVPTTFLQAAEPEMNVVAQYDMSHANGYLTDVSGNGNHAVLTGITDSDFSTVSGDTILTFAGNSSKYVTLPGGLIESEQFSIEAVFKADRTGSSGENSWLYCLGTQVAQWPNVKNYMFLCPAQGNNGNNAVGNIRAGIKDAANEVLLGQGQAITANAYNTVEMVFNNGKVTLSLNGKEIESVSTGYSIQDILSAGTSGNASGYIGRSLYSPDPPFRGTLTSFTIKSVTVDSLNAAKDKLTLPYNTTDKQVYGNITLPTKVGNDVAVTWKTSHPSIVDVSSHTNAGYDATPAGTVTRPANDTNVTMTATLTKGNQSATKEFTFTVKAAPDKLAESDLTDYFFAYFAGEGYSDGEQIYFAASRDGLNWTDLNNNKPILTSTLGEKGVRDPYIIRSAEGDKFYMIATDLRIYNGNGWGAAQTAGSQAIMVWESTDLVNWSEQRMVPISASIGAGCTWAPECYYDDITGEYIVYWASKVASDNYGKQRVYYAKTRDFYSFTEPKVFIDYNESSIDTTIIYDNATDMYYRYTKNEGGSTNQLGAYTKTVFVEKSSTLLGNWTHIPSNSLNSNQWVEGPAIFKFNQDDKALGSYCLLVDDFGGIGYYPLVANGLASGTFAVPSASYKMPTRARHGTPIPVTAEEYKAVMQKWSEYVEESNEKEQNTPKLTYTFEQTNGSTIIDDSASGNNGKLYGNAKVVYDSAKGSNVLYLDGTSGSYASLPSGFFDGRNKFTVSMDVKAANVSGNFFTFAIGKDSTKYYFLKTNQNSIKSVISTGSWGAEHGFTQNVNNTVLNNWINLTVVVNNNVMKLYVDGVLVAENTNVPVSITDLGSNLEAYLGKSFYSADNYFKGYFDNVKVYNRVLSDAEIKNPEAGEGESGNEGTTGSGLLAEYTFNSKSLTNTGTSGNKAAAVVTGLGAYSGSVVYETGKGGSGYAVRLGNYGLELNEQNVGEEYTVSFWAKPDGTIEGNSPVVALGYHNPEKWMAISGNKWPATNECKLWGNGGSFSTWTTVATPTIPSQWTHIVITGAKDSATLYIDGNEIGTYNSNNPLSGQNADVYIGVNYWDAEFTGLADDIKVYGNKLSKEEVAKLYKDENTQTEEVPSSLVANYSFDNKQLGNNATAVVTGLGSYTGDLTYETGKDGTGYAVRIGDYGLKLNQKNLGTNFTVSFWTKLDHSFSENQVLMLMGHHSPENWMAVSGDRSGYKFWGNGGTFSTWTTVAAPTLQSGKWHNLVFAGQSGKITAYLDGVSLGTFNSNDPLNGTDADIYLGVNYWDSEGVGLIDDVNIYKETLSAAVIKANYDKEKGEMGLAEAKEALALPTVISESIKLPSSGENGSSITWTTSNKSVLAADGTIVKRPAVGAGNAKVTLTANISLNGETVTKSFDVEVLEAFYGYIMGYIKGNNDRTGSLHLAYSTDGKNFTALNSNSGILFAHIDTNNGTKNLSTGIRFTSPHLFRKADGTFGFTATQSDRLTSVYMYDSKDLITYTGERLIDTRSTVGNPLKPEVEYDTLIGAYRLNWTAGGKEYSSVTRDLKALENAVAYDYQADTTGTGLGTVPSDAIVGNVIGVTKAEYDKVVKKLGRVTNTGIEKLEDITVTAGQSVKLPETITAYYSDDSITEMNINWNTSGINFSKAGTYLVSGTIEQEIYANPLIPQRADPHIEYDEAEDCYYFTASYPAYNNVNGGYDRIILRKANSIAGLSSAQEITIWQAPSSGLMAKHVWAPEIHKIEGKWYVFFAAGSSSNIWAIRPYVLVCQNNADPYNASSWKKSDGTAEVYAATSKNSAYFKNMSLDMTYFEHNGKHYVIWADIIGQSALYMQEINPSAPWAGTSDKVILLTTPEFGWERDSERVNEGPSVIKNNGKIYVAFSGSGTGPEYCIGLLYADENADLMNVNSWTKVSYPVLTSSDVPGEYGPGHNSFTVDDNGNAMFVYHARSQECYNNQCQWANSDPLYDPCRHARVKRVHWAADGTPVLNMSYEEELKPEFANITIKVVVEGNGDSSVVTDTSLLADFNFDSQSTGFTGGNAKATGSYSLVDYNGGKALSLNGSGQFLNVTAADGSSLLTGVEQMTISFKMNPSSGSTNWAFFAAPNTNTQTYLKERYVGVIDNNGTVSAERYNNSGSRPASPSNAAGNNKWIHVAVVLTKTETILYVNGKEVDRETSNYGLTNILGSSSVLYIGKATWLSSGEFYKGLIDDFKIYSRTLTASEIAAEAAK